MVKKLFVAIVVTVAVIAGILAITIPRDSLTGLIMFRDFFDMGLPILAFGALVKYLCSCCPASKCCCGSSKCCCTGGSCPCAPGKTCGPT